MINRLLSIPMTQEDHDQELDTIKTIATSNDIHSSIIENIKDKKKKQVARSLLFPVSSTEKSKSKCCGLPFIGKVSNRLGKVLKAKDFSVYFYVPHNLGKGQTDIHYEQWCIKNSFKGCQSCYIGQTGRLICTSLREHHRSWRLRKPDSAFAQRCLEQEHKYDKDVKVLHVEGKGAKLTQLEVLVIKKTDAHSPKFDTE